MIFLILCPYNFIHLPLLQDFITCTKQGNTTSFFWEFLIFIHTLFQYCTYEIHILKYICILLNDVIVSVYAEKMAANIREEIRRMQRRKQLKFHPQTSSGDSSDTEAPSSPSTSAVSSTTPFSHSSSGKEKFEKPLFTFRQVE